MMTRIKNILVPTDFSDASHQALRYACGLADAFGASLHLLHVGENPYRPGGYMEFYAPPPQLVVEVEREAAKMLQAALSPEEQARYGAVFVYRQGAPAQEILHYVQEQQHIDLIVMGTHGRGAIARLLMGNVAEKVLRAAPCPVLTIRPSGTAAGSASHAA